MKKVAQNLTRVKPPSLCPLSAVRCPSVSEEAKWGRGQTRPGRPMGLIVLNRGGLARRTASALTTSSPSLSLGLSSSCHLAILPSQLSAHIWCAVTFDYMPKEPPQPPPFNQHSAHKSLI